MALKKYEKDGIQIFEYTFNSISELLKYIENSKISSTWESTKADLVSEIGTYDFTKTSSLEEAINLCRYGYKENFDRIIKAKKAILKHLEHYPSSSTVINNVVGHIPNVPAYIEGIPLNMFDSTKKEVEVINIFLNVSVSLYVSTNDIINRGILTMTLVELLEKLGYLVNLKIVSITKSSSQIVNIKINTKKINETLNVKKNNFIISHPSFLRRICFRVRETTEGLDSDWTNGYGYPLQGEEFSLFIKPSFNDILIPNDIEQIFNRGSINEMAVEMIKVLKLEDKLKRIKIK